MTVRRGDIASDVTAETTWGPISFHQWKAAAWAFLFSYPRDFTPVCTTELGAIASLVQDFERLGTRVIGHSLDPVETYRNWHGDIARP